MTLLGFFVIALSIVALEVIARCPITKVAHLDQVIQSMLHTRSGRMASSLSGHGQESTSSARCHEPRQAIVETSSVSF